MQPDRRDFASTYGEVRAISADRQDMLVNQAIDRDCGLTPPVGPGFWNGSSWHNSTLRYTIGYCRYVARTPERSTAVHFGKEAWLEETLAQIPGLPDWSMTVVVGSEGTVERLVIEPRHVEDDSWRMLVCRHCGNDVVEVDERGVVRRPHRRSQKPTKPGPPPAGESRPGCSVVFPLVTSQPASGLRAPNLWNFISVQPELP